MTQDKAPESGMSRFVGGVIHIVPPIGAMVAMTGFLVALLMTAINPEWPNPLGVPIVKWLIVSGLVLMFLGSAGVIALAVLATLLLMLALVLLGVVAFCGWVLDHLLLLAERHVFCRRKR